jgi:3-dehydroquinate dehydratase type I
MRPRICVSISPSATSELFDNLIRAETLSADLVEVRLESLHDPVHLQELDARGKLGIPLIATNRPSARGNGPVPESARLDSLLDAVDAGFQFVDLELSTDNLGDALDKLREKGAKIILSSHDHSKTPSRLELESTLAKMMPNKPDICKLVTTAQTMADNLRVLSLLEERHTAMPLVCLAMGKQGMWSRILAPFYGAPFTYACIGPGRETAPGQPSISELRQIYDIIGNE